ncbi:hypothetical protein DERP_004186 [Dermatophagoides pteronyssinus]|uniref:Uncharacterized protein n=1 Tax=Dermatophagoides pteronyssinus TaxID=6956 RepID=A0ABQ8J8V9_DERPT|nr:hypothetical protein DERP_004186 [Dermatophagoides pteronyssinus]
MKISNSIIIQAILFSCLGYSESNFGYFPISEFNDDCDWKLYRKNPKFKFFALNSILILAEIDNHYVFVCDWKIEIDKENK